MPRCNPIKGVPPKTGKWIAGPGSAKPTRKNAEITAIRIDPNRADYPLTETITHHAHEFLTLKFSHSSSGFARVSRRWW
jgi:hypothetical protein